MKRIICILILINCFLTPFAQPVSVYPQDYFTAPLKIPLLLAGNFGECRPGHFHSGIDIKTNGKENLPVYAAADGYISRIKIEKGGFGHALYITHPEGFTTLYAHLNNFNPKLQSYLRKIQYEKESWAQDISLMPSQFPVKKGEQIAWSGNTGASTAPHLHFEIRDSQTEHPLNPQLFGFDIKDNLAPVPLKLAIYNVGLGASNSPDFSFYQQRPAIYALKKMNGIYTPADTIIRIERKEDWHWLRIAVELNDFMNESMNTLTFYTAEFYVDDNLFGRIRLDDIGYEVTRYINAYVDYSYKFSKGIWLQQFFQLPGNKLETIYERMKELTINDEQTHTVKMIFTDASGNSSTVSFRFKLEGKPYVASGKLPTSPSRPRDFKGEHFSFSLPDDALYDEVVIETGETPDAKSLSPRCTIHRPEVPVHTRFELKIKPDKPIPFSQRNKIVMMYSNGKDESGEAALQAGKGWYQVKTRNFGEYWLVADTSAPVITAIQKNDAILSKADRITFRVKENLTSVKSFRAELDGKWICFEPRGDLFFYEFDAHCPKGKHVLEIKVTDENDNSSGLKFSFTR